MYLCTYGTLYSITAVGWLASYCHAVKAAEVLRKVLKMLSDSFDLFALVLALTLALTLTSLAEMSERAAAGECRQQKPLDRSENHKRTRSRQAATENFRQRPSINARSTSKCWQ